MDSRGCREQLQRNQSQSEECQGQRSAGAGRGSRALGARDDGTETERSGKEPCRAGEGPWAIQECPLVAAATAAGEHTFPYLLIAGATHGPE